MAKKSNDVEAIYNAAVTKEPGAERSAYLNAVCGDDNVLRARVETLLKAHDQVGDYLQAPPVGPNATLDDSPLIDAPGTKIGRYELLELIGEGGMGLVYMAHQKKPVKRRVALKIIKPGMDSKQIIARFEAEKQTLAVLDHPNIAHVFDAGTTKEGRPYFIMEYVKGMSITRYCDEKKLDIEQRLRLFEQVCEGIHHAHQKGIIHRDLKPSNILVSVHGDRAVPKIIDFGIAKAVTQPLTEKTVVTFQGQLLGTPEYMSPEQVDLATQDIDTRSDIYSLGVVLYELLAGVLPFEREALKRAGFAEIQQTIREQEPPSPSIRLTSLGEKAKTIAASRGTQVIALARRLHRELEWIPLKAMRKDRCRRYRSASELEDDVRNYLNGLPLIAGPETAVYRARKFVHKHAGSVATVALVSATIVVGLIVSTTMYFRAEKMRELAVKAENVAEERAEEYRRLLYFKNIGLADVAYRDTNMHRLRELLELCPEDLRGWEWDRLSYIQDQALMTLRGHEGRVHSVSFSTDGKRMVSASEDKTVKVWDAATGAELMTLRGHSDQVAGVAFSPDGKRIVSGSADNTIRVWDAATGDELMTLHGHEGCVRAVSFSLDGKRIVSGSHDCTAKVWDAATGAELMTLPGHEGDVFSVAFRPNGEQIISAGHTIKVWDVATGAEVLTLRGHKRGVADVAFSPDGKRIVSASGDETIKVWDAASGAEVMTLRGHTKGLSSVAFSLDGRKIVSGGGRDNTVRVWDAATGTEVMTLRGHGGRIFSVAFSPDGRRIVSGSGDKTIRVWDATIDHELTTLHTGEAVESVAVSPDGRWIVSGNVDKTVKVWDAATGAEVMTLCGHGDSIYAPWSPVASVAFSPDGKRIVSGSTDKTVKVWDAATGAELMTMRGHQGMVYSAAFTLDGRRIVSGSVDKMIKIWDTATGEEVMSLPGHKSWIRSVAISPDGKRIVSGGGDKTIKVWDATSGAEVLTLHGHEAGVLSVAFSSNGKLIASGGYDKTINVWDAKSGAKVMTLRGHKDIVGCVAFSPDDKRIITGGYYDGIKIWDVETGAELITLLESGSAIAFSPDGKTIAIGSSSGITLLESEVPAGGYEPRRTTITARKVVDELHKEHGLYSNVIEKLKAHDTLEEPVRNVALQIANARLWEDAEKAEEPVRNDE